jgi:hypothetical protein
MDSDEHSSVAKLGCEERPKKWREERRGSGYGGEEGPGRIGGISKGINTGAKEASNARGGICQRSTLARRKAKVVLAVGDAEGGRIMFIRSKPPAMS